MDFLQRRALAQSTHKAYNSGSRAFQRFCAKYALAAYPASKMSTCLFATAISKRVGLSSVRSYLAAVAYQHKRRGLPDPTVDNPQLNLVVSGIRRVKAMLPSRRMARRPITPPMLAKLCKFLPRMRLNTFDQATFHAALTLASHGCLRVGEFTHSQYAGPQLQDISASRDSLVFHLRHSKTDQLFKGSHIVIGRSQRRVICPCKAMLLHLARRQRDPAHAPLFRCRNGTPLSRAKFVELLKKVVQLSGLNPDHYNSHSLRIGAATFAAQQGHTEDAIKRLGRWRSSAYRRYIRL